MEITQETISAYDLSNIDEDSIEIMSLEILSDEDNMPLLLDRSTSIHKITSVQKQLQMAKADQWPEFKKESQNNRGSRLLEDLYDSDDSEGYHNGIFTKIYDTIPVKPTN